MNPPVFQRSSKPYTPTPPAHEHIWRVMDLTKFETLAKGGLWLARLDQFGTTYEGSLPDQNRLGLLAMLPPDGAAWVEKQYDMNALRSYASCWHMNPADPPDRLWREFDKAGDGLAVRTTYSCLRAELARTCDLGPPGRGPIHVGGVRYINHAIETIPEWNVLEATFVVRDKWAYQNELRVLIHTHGTAAYDYLYNRSGPCGPLLKSTVPSSGAPELIGGVMDGKAIVLGVKPRVLIKEIVPNRSMPTKTLWRLFRMAARYRLAHRVRVDRSAAIGMKAAAVALQLGHATVNALRGRNAP